jgi:hypothetical protein
MSAIGCEEEDDVRCDEPFNVPFGFHSAYGSSTTGLLYFRNRWYESARDFRGLQRKGDAGVCAGRGLPGVARRKARTVIPSPRLTGRASEIPQRRG